MSTSTWEKHIDEFSSRSLLYVQVDGILYTEKFHHEDEENISKIEQIGTES